MLQLVALMGALFLGYAIRRLPLSINILNKGLFSIVVLILLVMGYELGSNNINLAAELSQLSKIVLVFTLCLFLANFMAGYWVLKKINLQLRKPLHSSTGANWWLFIRESGKYIVIIVLGIILGAIFRQPITSLNSLISALLFVLLFIIGHQMRLAGVSLREIIFNKNGLYLALMIMISSLLAGLIAAATLGLPLKSGMMLSSGFGWYTLSSILNTSFIDHNFGACSFFIDFIREVIAIILIPSLGQRYPATFVAYSGATAMDFSLPVIKQNLHEGCVLLAISSGMILSIAVPILITLFAKL
ncbi:MAG: DUF340 domain-containing protein [Neisseriaceae bacterium]|nr:MAG: DUF340 domain-containing protein [Neisseriaceae bacterium]